MSGTERRVVREQTRRSVEGEQQDRSAKRPSATRPRISRRRSAGAKNFVCTGPLTFEGVCVMAFLRLGGVHEGRDAGFLGDDDEVAGRGGDKEGSDELEHGGCGGRLAVCG